VEESVFVQARRCPVETARNFLMPVHVCLSKDRQSKGVDDRSAVTVHCGRMQMH